MLSLFSGAMDLERRPDGVLPVRFSPERLKEYRASPTAIYGHCTAGVRLDFVTGAPAVSFRYHLHTLFYPPVVFDVFEDGKWTASIREPDRSSGGEIVYRRRKQAPSRVTVYLPVHGETVLSHLEPGDSPRPAPEAENRLLVVSDSIGQGFLGSSRRGAMCPSWPGALGGIFTISA